MQAALGFVRAQSSTVVPVRPLALNAVPVSDQIYGSANDDCVENPKGADADERWRDAGSIVDSAQCLPIHHEKKFPLLEFSSD